MTLRYISKEEFEVNSFHGVELIHTRPWIVLKLGVVCAHCSLSIQPGLTHYKYEGLTYCVSCVHYHHERSLLMCEVCAPNIEFEKEVSKVETMICPDGTIVVSDDVVADIPMMRRMEEKSS